MPYSQKKSDEMKEEIMSKISPRDVYELVENDKGEIMILIYAKEPTPKNATFSLNKLSGVLKINRTKEDALHIAGLEVESIQKLSKIKQLYVCEIKYREGPNDTNEIVNVYAAALKKEQPAAPKQPAKKETISEKAQKARANALKKAGK